MCIAGSSYRFFLVSCEIILFLSASACFRVHRLVVDQCEKIVSQFLAICFCFCQLILRFTIFLWVIVGSKCLCILHFRCCVRASLVLCR